MNETSTPNALLPRVCTRCKNSCRAVLKTSMSLGKTQERAQCVSECCQAPTFLMTGGD